MRCHAKPSGSVSILTTRAKRITEPLNIGKRWHYKSVKPSTAKERTTILRHYWRVPLPLTEPSWCTGTAKNAKPLSRSNHNTSDMNYSGKPDHPLTLKNCQLSMSMQANPASSVEKSIRNTIIGLRRNLEIRLVKNGPSGQGLIYADRIISNGIILLHPG
jgi:hypothetical protein